MAAVGVRKPIRVIPNFLDCSEYRRRVDQRLRDELCPPGTQAVIAHMSNFRPVKRLDTVLEVFRRLRQRGVAARLLLIGDGPVRPQIEQMSVAYSLDDDVIFTGEQQDPVRWLSVADLFLLPSAQESFGLAALEAMACEVPVIASNAGGLPEIIEHGVTGFVCPIDAVDEMTQHAQALIEDQSRRGAMGRAAAGMVRARYCAERIVPLYENAYEDVLRG
jgi:N-acetyl-alpha-D-glucosaminyl L-malate synthase BshA